MLTDSPVCLTQKFVKKSSLIRQDRHDRIAPASGRAAIEKPRGRKLKIMSWVATLLRAASPSARFFTQYGPSKCSHTTRKAEESVLKVMFASSRLCEPCVWDAAGRNLHDNTMSSNIAPRIIAVRLLLHTKQTRSKKSRQP